MDQRDELVAIEAIRQLKARYFRTLDQQDWSGYRAVFTEDVVIDTTDDTGGPGTEPEDLDAYLTMLRPILEGSITVHHGHMSEIEILDADHARAIWAMEDHIWFSEAVGLGKLWGTGWYEERYRRVDGEWRIAEMVLRRQRVEVGGAQTFPPAGSPG